MSRSKSKAQSKKDGIRYRAEKIKRCKDCALYFQGMCGKSHTPTSREQQSCVYFKGENEG